MRKRQVEAVMGAVITLVTVYTVGNIIMTGLSLGKALQYRQALETEIGVLQDDNARLEQELRQAEDPSVMEQMARQKLGLVRQGEKIFCDINP